MVPPSSTVTLTTAMFATAALAGSGWAAQTHTGEDKGHSQFVLLRSRNVERLMISLMARNTLRCGKTIMGLLEQN